jgi:Cu2+-exporting ATPase
MEAPLLNASAPALAWGPDRPAYAEFDSAGVYQAYVRKLENGLSETHLMVEGIHCASCVQSIEQGLQQAGAFEAQLNYGNHRAAIRWDDSRIRLSGLLDVLHRLGYEGRPYDPQTQEVLHRRNLRAAAARVGVAGFCAMNVMLYSVGLYAGYFYGIEAEFHRLFQWVSALLALPAVFYSGWPFLRGCWAALHNRRLSMDCLTVLGIGGVFLHSSAVLAFYPGQETYFESVTMMVFFLLIGRFLETAARSRSGSVTERLAGMQVKWAIRLREGREESVGIAEVRVGDQLIVRPGDGIPADGTVAEGASEIEESAMTGESRRRPVGPGDTVMGGTVNVAAPLVITATRVGADTVLSRIVRLVEDAQGRKAPVQRLADLIAGRFVSIVIMLAGVTFSFWEWVLPNPHQAAFLIAVTVLIIACPCALGLATPVAVLAGGAAAARRGVLIKGGDVMELASQVTDVVLDKTGTLTTGSLTVTRVTELGTLPTGRWLPLAAAVERRAVHPIAQALQSELRRRGGLAAAPLAATEVQVLPGLGALGSVAGHRVIVGNRRLMEERAVSLAAHPEEDTDTDTLVYVAVDGQAVGLVRMADPLRPDAAEAVEALKAMGIAVHLFSGDRSAPVQTVARQTGITDARGGMLPGDKLEALRALQAQGRTVAMVGDGVNDAPAMTQADISMAVSTASDLSLEAAKMILLRARLMGAVEAIAISRRTFRVIQENLALSIGYNVLAIPLAMAGYVVPLVAAISMALSSLLVVGNALKLRRRDDGAARAPVPGSTGAEWLKCC